MSYGMLGSAKKADKHIGADIATELTSLRSRINLLCTCI